MSRNDFISDDLVDMRERLRRNYENFHAQQRESKGLAPMGENLSVTAVPVPEPPATLSGQLEKLPEKKEPVTETPPLPALHTAFDETAFAGERRDIEGQMIRDLARSEAETARRRMELEETEHFHSAVERLLTELRALDEAENLTIAEKKQKFHEISGAYFRALGKFEALESRAGGALEAASPVQLEKKPFFSLCREQLPLSLAILAAAILITVTLLLVFG